jgi:hypothetical protein
VNCSECGDEISGEIVNRLEWSNLEASACSHRLPTVDFDYPCVWPEMSGTLKCHLVERGRVQTTNYSASVWDDTHQFTKSPV